MRRAALISLAVLAVVGALISVRGQGPADYRVDIIFDTAKGMVPGQLVKVAGVRVGTVRDVRLTPGRKALLSVEVDPSFAPFRADAHCRIQPEGFISENYVECDPGDPSAPVLTGPRGTPTVPVSRTAAQITLQDLINTFASPAPDQLQVLLNQLGIAAMGRGSDINAILRRVNPALTQARRVLAIARDQRRDIAHAVTATDEVVTRLAAEGRDVRRFVTRTAAIAGTTAARESELRAALRGLPPLTRAARTGLRSLDLATENLSPLADQLRKAAPALADATTALPGFTATAVPALRALGNTAARGRPAVRRLRPTTQALVGLGRTVGPVARDLEALITNTRDRGGFESSLHLLYTLATVMSAYDGLSHIATISGAVAQGCLTDKSSPGCDRRFTSPGNGTIPRDCPECGPQEAGNRVRQGQGQPTPLTRSEQVRLARQLLRELPR